MISTFSLGIKCREGSTEADAGILRKAVPKINGFNGWRKSHMAPPKGKAWMTDLYALWSANPVGYKDGHGLQITYRARKGKFKS